MSRRGVDACSLASGIAIAVLGVLLGLDAAGTLELGLGYVGPLLMATAGVALFTSGLRRGGGS